MNLLKKAAIGLAALIVLFVLIAFLLPRQAHVERTATIDAPAATVFALVNNLHNFNRWSPWKDADPQARYTFDGPVEGVGAKMSWVGDPSTVGTGSMTIRESRPNEMIGVDLDFVMDGTSNSTWTFVPEGSGTKTTRAFDSDLENNPINRWRGLLYDRMIGAEYEQGLAGLKTLAESIPRADLAGFTAEVIEVAPVTLAYVPRKSAKDGESIKAAITDGYMKVGAFMKAKGLQFAGAPITINTKWDDTGYEFDAAIPVDRPPETPAAADDEVRVKPSYGGRVIKVEHTGAYSGLDETYNKLFAWAALNGYEQNGPPWDEYVTDPGIVPEPELRTNVYLPVK